MKSVWRLSTLACFALAAGCSGPTVTTQPSGVTDDLALTCPADVSVTAHSGISPTVTFDLPHILKGTPPVTVTCMPPSGGQFPTGVTTVTCNAIDARSHMAACNFSVTVTPIPQLLKTRFITFGDSLTEGKTKLIGPTILQVPDKHFNAAGSYPEILNAMLTTRYQDQAITLIADGLGLEQAGEGKLRLKADWPQYNPDALLVMEGTNDLTDFTVKTTADVNGAMDSVIDALRTDITFAKSRGAMVFLGTIVSLLPPAPALAVAAVPTLNTRIKALAVEQNVTLVDINAVVPLSMISTIDGIHPKPVSDAYSLMAAEWLKAIVATMEVKPSSLR